MSQSNPLDLGRIWQKIQSQLSENGIDIDFSEGLDVSYREAGKTRVKVVCVKPDLKESVREMWQRPRDQVVMVRVDEETLESLDAWVAAGAVKSRSEAAALFIREGLQVRADELAQLRDALREVQEAQERLKKRAAKIFGGEDDNEGQADAGRATNAEAKDTDSENASPEDAAS